MRIKFFLVFFLFVSLLRSQTEINGKNLKGVDEVINKFMDHWDIPGGSVAITKNGKLIYNKGFGHSAANKIASPNDLYRIASVSKPITSIAIMKLVEEGRLSLSDTVFGKNKILNRPYYLEIISDKRIYSITVQQLLEHTAGWDRDKNCDGFGHYDPPFFPLHVSAVEGESDPVGDSTLIKFSLRRGLNHKPGNTFAYSNVGYLVLGKVIEKISGMKYEEYVRKNILEPLSIRNMHLGKNLFEKRFPGEAQYFGTDRTRSCYNTGAMVPWQYGGFNLEAMNAHGGWIASASDLTKLMLATDGYNSVPDILSKASIETMTKPNNVHTNYAKGWSVNKHNRWHTGSLDGSAAFVCITDDGYTWAFLFNSRNDNSDSFWNAFDRLPWNCLDIISQAVAGNL